MGMVLDGDATRLALIIVLVFLAGLAICGLKVQQVSAELDRIRAPRSLSEGAGVALSDIDRRP